MSRDVRCHCKRTATKTIRSKFGVIFNHECDTCAAELLVILNDGDGELFYAEELKLTPRAVETGISDSSA